MQREAIQRLFIFACAGGSVTLFVWWIYAGYSRLASQAALDKERRRAISSFLLLLVAPLANVVAQWLTPRIDRIEARCQATGHTSFLVALRHRSAMMLTGAGRPHGLTPNEFMGIWTVSRVLGMLVGMLCYALILRHWEGIPAPLVLPFVTVVALLPELTGLWVILGIVVLILSVAYYALLLPYWPGTPTVMVLPFLILGALLPWIWLRDCERKRKRVIRNDLPYALDLLTLSVEAGLDFTAALARIVGRRPDKPLAEELGETLRQIQMGVPRAQALRDLHDRVRMEEIFSVTSALIQADELGASLGPILRIQADQFRVRRAQAAEKAAMEAPVKLLFPLICFFFPATFIMLFGPIFIRFVAGE